jgi:hypothetical protein
MLLRSDSIGVNEEQFESANFNRGQTVSNFLDGDGDE